jgi:hypothetical protein
MATCCLGGSLRVFWPFRDGCAGLQIESLPAVFFLAGDDEDLLARGWFAKLGLVEAGNLAEAANRRWQEAEVRDVAAFVAAAAARFLAEYHDVLVQFPGNGQIEPHPIRAVLNHERADITAGKHGASGDFEGFREAHDGPDGADGLPELLARQRFFLGEAGVAHHLGTGHDPAVVLFRAQPGAPLPGVVAEDRADVLARWGEGGLLGDVLPQT